MSIMIAANLCAASSIGGCEMQKHKSYGYELATRKYSWGVVEVRLRGAMKEIDPHRTELSSPYEVIVSVRDVDTDFTNMGCSLRIERAIIEDSATGERFPLMAASTPFKLHRSGEVVANSILGKLDLKHKNYKIFLKLSFLPDSCIGKGPFEDVFDMKMHYEEKTIGFWDALMGI